MSADRLSHMEDMVANVLHLYCIWNVFVLYFQYIFQVEVKLFSLSHMGVEQWHCHPVSPLFCRPTLQHRRRQKLQLALVTRRKQLMPRLEMLRTAPDCAENNWTKWGYYTPEKRHGFMGADCANLWYNLQFANQFPPTNKLIAPPSSCSTIVFYVAQQKATQARWLNAVVQNIFSALSVQALMIWK